uniref:Uncharacterized protein n=1 Tax=Rhizophora mucronata TaxID=61149 RepID=A0A2P2NC54_RHIMU
MSQCSSKFVLKFSIVCLMNLHSPLCPCGRLLCVKECGGQFLSRWVPNHSVSDHD